MDGDFPSLVATIGFLLFYYFQLYKPSNILIDCPYIFLGISWCTSHCLKSLEIKVTCLPLYHFCHTAITWTLLMMFKSCHLASAISDLITLSLESPVLIATPLNINLGFQKKIITFIHQCCQNPTLQHFSSPASWYILWSYITDPFCMPTPELFDLFLNMLPSYSSPLNLL